MGPTAVGKTKVAIDLAKHFETSVISADARQVYKELVIGTAKPTPQELQKVKHYFIDTHSIKENFNAGMFGEQAEKLMYEIFQKHDWLILCGGSGLYIKALLEGFDNMPKVTSEIRDSIIGEYESKGLAWLQGAVMKADPEFYESVDKSNPQRLIRALEVFRSSGEPFSAFKTSARKTLPFEVIKIGLELERAELYSRIDKRMDEMIKSGLFDEARSLYMYRDLNALQTVGYSEIFDFIDGLYDKEEATRLLKRNSRRYAKRQLTWFNADREITWFHPNDYQAILNFIREKSSIL